MTRAANAETPFSGSRYRENEGRCRDRETPCARCGKPVTDPWEYTVRVLGGGARYAATKEEHEHEGEHDAGDMGCFPVGSACARKLRKAGVHVGEWRRS